MNKYILSVSFLLVFVFGTAFSQFDLNKTLPYSNDVIYDSLSNGLKYYIKKNSKPENRAEIQLIVRAGSLQEKDSQLGLAHFLEHMAFNGTKNFPGNEVIKYMESTGMRFGSDINASTSWERTYYTLQVPTDNQKMFDDGFLVLKDWLTGITLDKEEIDKERTIIIEEWRLRTQNAQGRLQMKQFDLIFKGSDYVKSPIGDTNVIMTAPRSEFVDYYNTYYQPDISAVIAVGDFDPKQVEAKIKEMFKGIPRPKKATDIGEHPLKFNGNAEVELISDPELQINLITAVVKRPKNQVTGTYGAYRNTLVVNLLNSMLGQRYQEVALKGDAPFLQGVSSLTDFPGGISALYNVVALKADKMKEGYEAYLTELYRAKKHGFVASELERAKTEVMKNYESFQKEKDKTESRNFAAEFSRHFLENEGFPGIDHEVEIVNEFLPKITLEEINKLMSEIVTDKDLVMVHSGPNEENLIPKDELLSIFRSFEKKEIEPYVDKSAGLTLMKEKPAGGSFVEMDEDDTFDLTKYTLNNGVKVILKKTKFKNDEVMMLAYSSGGASLADVKNLNNASNAASIVNYSGIADMDLTSLQKVLTGKNVNVSPFIGNLTEGLRGSASPDDMEAMFQLIYLYFDQPRKDEESFKSFISSNLELVKQSKNNPESVFRDSLNYLLSNYHPRSKPTTEEDIKSIDLNKAYEFYMDRFADASDFTFVFVGNFEDSQINPLITTYLGALPNKGRKELWKDNGERMPTKKMNKSFKIGKDDNATVRMVMNGGYEFNPMNDLKLDAMSRVLSILLLEEIREKLGGVYGISAFNRTSKFPDENYQVYVAFGCEPARVKELTGAVEGVMKRLKNESLDAEYLKRATETMKSEFKKQTENNNFWVSNIYFYDFYQMDMNFINNYISEVDKLTMADVQNAAKKYLDMNTLKTIVRYPESFKE